MSGNRQVFSGGSSNTAAAFLLSLAIPATIAVLATPEYRLLCSIALLSLPFAIWPSIMLVTSRNRYHLPLAVVSLALWIYFCAPSTYAAFPVGDGRRVFGWTEMLEGVTYAGAAIAAFVIGYYRNWLKPSPLFAVSDRLSGSKLSKAAYAFFIIGWLYVVTSHFAHNQLMDLGRVTAIFENFTTFGYAFALLSLLRGHRSPLLIGAACVSLAGDLALIVASTLLAPAVTIAGALCLVYLVETRRVPWKMSVFAVIALLPPFLNRDLHRNDQFRQTDEGSLVQRIQLGLQTLEEDYTTWDWNGAMTGIEDQAGTRFETATFLAHCINRHESGKEFKHGYKFLALPLVLVPRTFFPWKPVNDSGSSLSEEYDLKDPYVFASINFPWLVEFYINFGAYGMVIAAFGAGLFVRGAFNMAAMGQGDWNLLIFVQLLRWLFNVESDVLLIFGNMLQVLIVWWVISRLLRGGFAGSRVRQASLPGSSRPLPH